MKPSKGILLSGQAATASRPRERTTRRCVPWAAVSLLVAAWLSGQALPAQAVEVYTFESLAINNFIDGQEQRR